MRNIIYEKAGESLNQNLRSLRSLLERVSVPFRQGDSIGIKLHWGERGNDGFLPPDYAREIVRWLKKSGALPFTFDTTVLYSGGRRDAATSLKTAAEHGYTPEFLGCPIIVADGKYGRDVLDIPSGHKHFETVQVASLVNSADGFVIFSHFKGHLQSCFGGAIKNIGMGFASRAQKQRMHADAHPMLKREKCTMCGICMNVCPVGAAQLSADGTPEFDLDKCVGCAQCIGLCPQIALKIFWNTDMNVFQEKLVETAAAVWKIIAGKTVLINAAIKIMAECDCMPGENHVIADDAGFIAGYNPIAVDEETLHLIGAEHFDKAHPDLPWQRQFEYAREIGFH